MYASLPLVLPNTPGSSSASDEKIHPYFVEPSKELLFHPQRSILDPLLSDFSPNGFGQLSVWRRKRVYKSGYQVIPRCLRCREGGKLALRCSCRGISDRDPIYHPPPILRWIQSSSDSSNVLEVYPYQNLSSHPPPLSLLTICLKYFSKTIFPLGSPISSSHVDDVAISLITVGRLEYPYILSSMELEHYAKMNIELPFTLDLHNQTKSLLLLLQEIQRCLLLTDSHFLREKAFVRAGRFLLLKSLYPSTRLVPPLDVMAVLLSVLIRTDLFFELCSDELTLIDFAPPLIVLNDEGEILAGNATPLDISETQLLYNNQFSEDFPFKLSLVPLLPLRPLEHIARTASNIKDLKSRNGWHIADYLQPETVIGDQMLLPTLLKFFLKPSIEDLLSDASLLRDAIIEYQRFLVTNISHRRFVKQFIPLDIDLIWTVHTVFPRCYETDLYRFLGFSMSHAPPIRKE